MKTDIVPDTLKITFVNQDGTNYSDPIVVEYLTIGQSVPGETDFRVNAGLRGTMPATAATSTTTTSANTTRTHNS